MTRPHCLLRLALAAVWSAPKRPLFRAADGVTGIPELRGDTTVAGIFQHAGPLAVLDFPADFRPELEIVTPVIDGPTPVCFHVNSVVRAGDQIFQRTFARQQADIGHSDQGDAVPAFGPHAAV